jgi:phenylalanine ammonia-lyase
MGLKGLQITGNSIMPMLTYFGNPLVEHFPTHAEQFNQNVNGLSWGSANLAWNSVELFTQYVSIALIFGVQSLDLRAYALYGNYDGRALVGAGVLPLYESVYTTLARQCGAASPLIFNDADQLLEDWLQLLAENIDRDGSIVNAVTPIVDSFVNSGFGE